MFRPDDIFNYFLSNGEIKDEWHLPTAGRQPTKAINTPADLEVWMKSKGLGMLLTSLLTLTDSLTDTEIPKDIDPKIKHLIEVLNKLDDEINNFATARTEKTNNRFGDPNVLKYHAWIVTQAPILLHDIGPLSVEANSYFCESYGSSRLDFGSGHELNFLAFLIIQYKMNETKSFANQLIKVVYARYIELVRKIIVSFNLEPAGNS